MFLSGTRQPTGPVRVQPTRKLAAGLVAAYPLSVPHSHKLFDASLFGNDAVFSNNKPTWTETTRGTVLTHFNGDYATLTNPQLPQWDEYDGITISCWYRQAFAFQDTKIWDRLWNFTWRTIDGNSLAFTYMNTTETFAHQFRTDNDVIVDGQWHHLVFRFIYGTGSSAAIFVDGVPVSASWVAEGDGSEAPATSSLPVTIGRMTAFVDHPGEYVQMQNLMVWKRAITDQEVRLLNLQPWIVYQNYRNLYAQMSVEEIGVLGGGAATVSQFYAIVPQGGVLANGDSLTTAKYTLSTQGGVVAGGVAAVEAGMIAEGGVEAGGDTVPLATYEPTIAGGLVAGAAAEISVVSVMPTSGGVLGGSAADYVFVFQPIISGGLVAGGLASVQSTTSLQATLTPDHEITANLSPVHAFVTLSPDCVISAALTATYQPTTQGGIEVGSAALISTIRGGRNKRWSRRRWNLTLWPHVVLHGL